MSAREYLTDSDKDEDEDEETSWEDAAEQHQTVQPAKSDKRAGGGMKLQADQNLYSQGTNSGQAAVTPRSNVRFREERSASSSPKIDDTAQDDDDDEIDDDDEYEFIIEAHEKLLEKVRQEGVQWCSWERNLDHWSNALRDKPLWDMGNTQMILSLARLTKNGKPINYEVLRRLGSHILRTDADEGEVEADMKVMKEPVFSQADKDDEDKYSLFCGRSESWTREGLRQLLETLRGSNSEKLKQELLQEDHHKFIVTHVRSGRYHPVELGAILESLVQPVEEEDSAQKWKELAGELKGVSARDRGHDRKKEAEEFIVHCAMAINRGKQTLEGAVKRNCAAGIILLEHPITKPEAWQPSVLEKWCEKKKKSSAADHGWSNLKMSTIYKYVKEEFDTWKKIRDSFYERNGVKVKDQPLFGMLSDDSFSQLTLQEIFSKIQSYCERKKTLRDVAKHNSIASCVSQALSVDPSSSVEEQVATNRRFVAVFGYHQADGRLVSDVIGQPEQAVRVRSVGLTRHSQLDGLEHMGGQSSEDRDEKIFEVGLSISGLYCDVEDGFGSRGGELHDIQEQKDILRTSGLGLTDKDEIRFFEFVPAGEYRPKARDIEELLKEFVETKEFPHVALSLPNPEEGPPSAPGNPYTDIVDAGGRFLMDLKLVGRVKTGSLQYHSLRMALAASVGFRRLAVLIPPSLQIGGDVDVIPRLEAVYQQDRQQEQHETRSTRIAMMDREKGFSESAEIVAEVLSLLCTKAALNKIPDIDGEERQRRIQAELEQSPRLLYYTSIGFLRAFDESFARDIADFWYKKLVNWKGFLHLSQDERESRIAVQVLLTSGVPDATAHLKPSSVGHAGTAVGAQETPRHVASHAKGSGGGRLSSSTGTQAFGSSKASPASGQARQLPEGVASTGEKTVALVSDAHLQILPDLIRNETHFSQEEVYVEESNFESVLLRLRRASPTSMTFFFVYVTGRISSEQLGQIVDTSNSAVKLIIRNTLSVLNLLELAAKPGIVHRPESIRAIGGQSRIGQYTPNSPVGSVVCHVERELAQDKYLMVNLASNDPDDDLSTSVWNGAFAERYCGELDAWCERLAEWVVGGTTAATAQSFADFVRLVVVADPAQALVLLQARLDDAKPQPETWATDAGPGSEENFIKLRQFLDTHGGGNVFAGALVDSGVVHSLPNNPTVSEAPQSGAGRVVIVSNASSLPHSRLEALVTLCCIRKVKLVLLMTECSSALSHFRVFAERRAPPVGLRVTLVGARLQLKLDRPCCASSVPEGTRGGRSAHGGKVAGLRLSHISERSSAGMTTTTAQLLTVRAQLVFCGLQLIFSPQAVVTTAHQLAVQEAVKDSVVNLNPLAFLTEIEGVGRNCSYLDAMIQELAAEGDDVVDPDIVDPNDADDLDKRMAAPLTIAQVLARHVNRYLRFPNHPSASLVSFADFVRQPLCRFLGHSRRLEAYICFLWHRTDRANRVCVKDGIHSPFGIPLGTAQKDVFPNIQSALSPGECLHYTYGSHPPGDPHYFEPREGDIVVHKREIIEHRALKGDELDWERIWGTWTHGTDLLDEQLDHVLTHSPSRISILLCMTQTAIRTLQLSREALEAVAADFQHAAMLLRNLPIQKNRELRTRSAAIGWLLLTTLGDGVSADMFGEDDQRLLFDVGVKAEASQGNKILARIAAVLVQMDRDDALEAKQQAVRTFLLCDDNAEDVITLFRPPGCLRLGSAFIKMLCDSEVLTGIVRHHHGNVILNPDFLGLEPVLSWVKNPDSADIESMQKAIDNLPVPLSPRALTSLVCACTANNTKSLVKARDGFLLKSIHRLVHDAVKSGEKPDTLGGVFQTVLQPLIEESKSGLAVMLMEVMCTSGQTMDENDHGGSLDPANTDANTDDFSQDEYAEQWANRNGVGRGDATGSQELLVGDGWTLEGLDKIWSLLWYAMKLKSPKAVEELISASTQDFQLPFESSALLRQLYVQHFCRPNKPESIPQVKSDLELHHKMLRSDIARKSMRVFLEETTCATGQDPPLAALALLWYTWWATPWLSVKQRPKPIGLQWEAFKAVLMKVNPGADVVAKGLSAVARFALMPHTLPASFLNALGFSILGKEQMVTSSTYVLAQKGHQKWPAYTFRVHRRPLPRDCIYAVIEKVSGIKLASLSAIDTKIKPLLDRFPITNRGVSVEIVRHNLKVLENLNKNPGAQNRYHIALTILTWFDAAGFSQKQMLQMCTEDGTRKSVEDVLRKTEVECEKAGFVTALVFEPLPVYLDVRWCLEGSSAVQMFQCSEESSELTCQWLHALLLAYGLEQSSAPADFRMHADKVRNGEDHDPNFPKQIVREMMVEIANHLVAKHSGAQHNVLEDTVPLADFFLQISSQSHGSQGTRELSPYAAEALEGITEGLKCTNGANQGTGFELQKRFSDAFYLVVGVTVENMGLEVAHMADLWVQKGLKCAKTVVNEINFMADAVYQNLHPVLYSRLTECATKLEKCMQDHSRPTAGRDLKWALKQGVGTSFDDVYGDLARSNEIIPFAGQRGADTVQKLPTATGPGSGSHLSNDISTAYDHYAGPQALKDSIPFTPLELFSRPNTDDSRKIFSQRIGARPALRKGRGTTDLPRTVSARQLLSLDPQEGYAMLRVKSGLHPVLRSPRDHCMIPVWQQKSLQSFDRSEVEDSQHPKSKIDGVFSHNGETWARLDKLQSGSTLMGNGFYLRKSDKDGNWMLLLGTAKDEFVENPPYVLWMLLDSCRLGAIDFDPAVLDVFKTVVTFSKSDSTSNRSCQDSHQSNSDQQLLTKLSELRQLHSLVTSGKDSSSVESAADPYLKYLLRECTICQHLRFVIDSIRRRLDRDEAVRLQTTDEALNAAELGEILGVTADEGQALCDELAMKLACFMPSNEALPRSELLYSLDLVIANQQALIESVSSMCSQKVKTLLHLEKLKVNGPDAGEVNDEEDVAAQTFQQLLEEHAWAQDLPLDEMESLVPEWTEELGDFAVLIEKHVRREWPVQIDITRDRLIAPHEHVTQHKFLKLSRKLIVDIEKRGDLAARGEFLVNFEDSDDEADDSRGQASWNGAQQSGGITSLAAMSSKSIAKSQQVVQQHSKKLRYHPAVDKDSKVVYEDSEMDRPLETHDSKRDNLALFPNKWGYGAPVFSPCCVLSMMGDAVPLYFWRIDSRKLKITYTDADGLPIAYVFHKRLLKRSLDYYKRLEKHRLLREDQQAVDDEGLLGYRELLLRWLTDVCRSPLPTVVKSWFLNKLEQGNTINLAPRMGDLNLSVIAHCLATALPAPNELAVVFRRAFSGEIPPDFMHFCKRRNGLYGIHIVQGGTLAELQRFGAALEECPLGYDHLTGSKSNASMYLEIIGHFSSLTWLVYVTGLDTIDDALLKWLAEYTKEHPWRFVFLENTQTSWNFSENRDRCELENAPAPVERDLSCTEDLDNPSVAQLRPNHVQHYPNMQRLLYSLKLEEQEVKKLGWDELGAATAQFFIDQEPASKDAASWDQWQQASSFEEGFQSKVKALMLSAESCVVLLCSPPGAGKSYFADELRQAMSKQGFGQAFIDGSDDRLVDKALLEILELEVPISKVGKVYLVVDEFHMLAENHKTELFEWLFLHQNQLHVLLIANRKDSRDDELLQSLRVGDSVGDSQSRALLVQTRLGRAQVKTVMAKNHIKHQEEVLLWMHCCRSLFGGEAVSLRFIAPLDERMQALENSSGSAATDLVKLLLSKVPTISCASAEDFVSSFLTAVDALHNKKDLVQAVASAKTGPISVMVQAALLTRDSEAGIDFPDFVSSATGLRRAYDGPPAFRIAAWCCHLRAAAMANRDVTTMSSPTSIFDPMLVDQHGFPVQLRDPADTTFLRQGRAFSWNGDYTRMHDIIDAVKRGHSVDWMDVHRRCWSLKMSPVLDGGALVKLLSVCNSPGTVLRALTRENLCTLLKKSAPEETVTLASAVLSHQIGKDSIEDDGMYSPWSLALWMLVVHEETLKPEMVISKVGGEEQAVAVLTWASKNMSDWRTVYRKIDPEERGMLVWKTLMQLSIWLLHQPAKAKEVPRLWQNMFAPLLRVVDPTDSSERGDSLCASDVALQVAIEAEDCNSNWDPQVQNMWAVVKRKGTSTQVAELWEKSKQLFFAAGKGRSKLHPKVSVGVLSMPKASVLPHELKEALLQTGSNVDIDDLDDVDSSIALLTDVIQQMQQQQKDFIIPDGPWAAKVREAAQKLG